MNHVLGEPGIRQQLLCSMLGSILAPIGGPLFGYNSAGLPLFEKDPDAPFKMTQEQKSLFASSIAIGGVLGSLCSGWLTTHLGRRKVLAALVPPCSAAWLATAFAPNYPTMLSARLILGIGTGISMPIGNIYLAETAAPSIRGFITSSTMAWQVFYTLLNYVLALVMDWKALAIVNGGVLWAYFPVAFFVPESPTWLLMKGRREACEEAVMYLKGYKPDNEDHMSSDAARKEVSLHVDKMAEHLEESSKNRATFRDIFEWNYLKSVLILSSFVALRQWTGIYSVLAFTVDIFKSVSSSSQESTALSGPIISPEISTIIVGVIHLIFIIVSTFLVDKIGRKALICGSVTVMGIGHTMLGLYCWLDANGHGSQSLSWLPLVSMAVFIIAFSLGIASALFVLMGELVPVRIRNQATGLSAMTNHASLFAVLNFYYSMKEAMTEAGLFWFYGGVCFLLAIFTFIVLPETKGKSLEEVERKVTNQRARQDGPVTSKQTFAATNPAFMKESA